MGGERQTGEGVDDKINSCYKCIRNGWVWCSNKWNYETASTDADYNASVEKGKCCYKFIDQSLKTTERSTANTANCPVRWSNTNVSG